MRKRIQNALILFGVQFFNYGMIVFSYRIVQQMDYTIAVLTDIIYGAINYFVIRRIAKSEEDWISFVGYTCGGALGTVVGMFISKVILGK